MYERLDKLRTELEKAKERRDIANKRVRELENKLREAENTQILDEVKKLQMTPEELAKFLKLAKEGKIPFSTGSKLNLDENTNNTEENLDEKNTD